MTAEESWATICWRFNLAEMARYLGISRQAISRWRHVPKKHLDKTSAYTGVAPGSLRPDLYPAPADPWSVL